MGSLEGRALIWRKQKKPEPEISVRGKDVGVALGSAIPRAAFDLAQGMDDRAGGGGFRAPRFSFGLLVCRFRLHGEPKPIFSDQKPFGIGRRTYRPQINLENGGQTVRLSSRGGASRMPARVGGPPRKAQNWRPVPITSKGT
jgi:hypothetical protein